MTEMTSKQRMLAAMRRQETDRVPVPQDFWTAGPPEQQFTWESIEDEIAWMKRWGFDGSLYLPSPWEGFGEARIDPAIERRVWQEDEPGETAPLLCCEWRSPKGTLSAKIRRSDDYPFDAPPFFNDFNSPRYVKPLLADGRDMLTFIEMDPYGVWSEQHLGDWRDECGKVQRLAAKEGLPVGCSGGTALDYLIWGTTAEQAIYLALEHPRETYALLDYLNGFSDRRVKLCLERGAEFVIRRGWYESADFWGPKQFADFAAPFIRREVDLVHEHGAASVYLMCTGVEPMLEELDGLEFDCLQKTEPVATGQDLRRIADALKRSKSFWTGLSAPLHIGQGSEDDVRRAVREAFDIFGTRGLLLMATPSIRAHWPWERNLAAMMDEYRRVQSSSIGN